MNKERRRERGGRMKGAGRRRGGWMRNTGKFDERVKDSQHKASEKKRNIAKIA